MEEAIIKLVSALINLTAAIVRFLSETRGKHDSDK